MRHLALPAFLPLLFAASRACADEPTQVFVNHGELHYVGGLDEHANARLFALYDGLKDKPTTLAIRSRGGRPRRAWRWATGYMTTSWT